VGEFCWTSRYPVAGESLGCAWNGNRGRGAFTSQVRHHVEMIFGAHMILFSKDADADRSFLSEVFGFESIDA
jgi:hypothetical protein